MENSPLSIRYLQEWTWVWEFTHAQLSTCSFSQLLIDFVAEYNGTHGLMPLVTHTAFAALQPSSAVKASTQLDLRLLIKGMV